MTREHFKWSFWSCITFIVFGLLCLGLDGELALQFKSRRLKEQIHLILLFAMPLALCIAMFFDYHLHKERRSPPVEALFTAVLCIMLFILSLSLEFVKSGLVDDELLYRGRFSDKMIIVQRKPFGRTSQTLKVTPLNFLFRWAREIDKPEITEAEWVEVPKEERQLVW